MPYVSSDLRRNVVRLPEMFGHEIDRSRARGRGARIAVKARKEKGLFQEEGAGIGFDRCDTLGSDRPGLEKDKRGAFLLYR